MERIQDLWQGNRWNILALDQSYGFSNAISLGVGIAAIGVYIRDGVRDSDEAE